MKKKISDFDKWYDSKSSKIAWDHIISCEGGALYRGMKLSYQAGYRAAMRKKGKK